MSIRGRCQLTIQEYDSCPNNAGSVNGLIVGDIEFTYDDLYRLAQMARKLLDAPKTGGWTIGGITVPAYTSRAQLKDILEQIAGIGDTHGR
jgi:hypothetical protein